MKFKAIVSLIALAAAATASQAAVQTTKDQQDVFLAVYDDANKASYLFDTGLNASSVITPGVNYSVNISNDATFTSFLSTVGANANLLWALGAYSSQAGKNTQFWYTTTTNSATPTQSANGTFKQAIGVQLTALTNTTVNSVVNPTSSEVDAFGTAAYFGSNFDDGTKIGTTGVFNSVGATNQNLFKITNTNTNSAVALDTVADTGTVAQFNQVGGVYTFSVTTPAAAVPEPESYALALIGLTAVGFMARRRAK